MRAREEAEASMRIQAELMTIANNKFGKEGPNWKPGDRVWLDGKNLNLLYASNKLKPRRFGPFTITDRIGQGSYKIKLPPTWKIHPVFHALLLTQAKETIEHGPNFERLPPDMVEGSPEYEVECDGERVHKSLRMRNWEVGCYWDYELLVNLCLSSYRDS